MKTAIGRREYTTEVHKQDTAQNANYAKILEGGLVSSTFKAYARDVISRAAALQRTAVNGAAQDGRV